MRLSDREPAGGRRASPRHDGCCGLDCGGLEYIAVGYGPFTQLSTAVPGGHVSLGLPRRADTQAIAGRVRSILADHGLLGTGLPPLLLA